MYVRSERDSSSASTLSVVFVARFRGGSRAYAGVFLADRRLLRGGSRQQGGMGRADQQGPGHDEAVLAGQRDHVLDLLRRYVSGRLRQQQRGVAPDQPSQIAQDAIRMGDLVQDRERQGEIEGSIIFLQIDGILGTHVTLDAVEQPGSRRASLQHVQHLWLTVDADNLAAGADRFGHRQTEEAHRTTEVQDCHVRSDKRSDDPGRVLQQLPEPTGQKVTNPDWTHVRRHRFVLHPVR